MPRARETQTQSSHEFFGLALLGAGTLLFLALISYAPVDVPTWFPLKDFAKTSRTTSNFIGSFGAILACSLYTFLGAAAYLVCAVLLGYGGSLVFRGWTEKFREHLDAQGQSGSDGSAYVKLGKAGYIA